MKIVYTAQHREHAPEHELEGGRAVPAKDVPDRLERVMAAIRERGLGAIVEPSSFGLEPIARVHTPELLAVLDDAWARWRAHHGDAATHAIPSVWPPRAGRHVATEDIDALLGRHSFDTATPLLAGTWTAARSAVDVALTATALVRAGERAAFAATRPPGHHATVDQYGGYCFLANAAIAVQSCTDAGMRVAVVDVDMHHGKGTQSIFYARADVLAISIHGDPAHFYPHYSGFADERGEGAGTGANLNLPLPPGADWSVYRDALRTAVRAVESFAPDVLVVPLGVDTYEGDPAGGLALVGDDYLRLGETLAGLRLPTVITMEGGYRLDAIGPAVANVLTAFASG
jgi:acetoin utilization deacetylase AcuC-like enzyme